jgi:molybdate transport system regulatory protein
MASPKKFRPRVRILFGQATALGPGRADLLEAIEASGSISGAAREMGMSYRRAWNLVDAMNKEFRTPLVQTSAGGRKGGGAVVTDLGREVVKRYRTIEEKATSSVATELSAFADYLARGGSDQ